MNLTGALAGKTVIAIASGRYHNLVLCSDGTLATWTHGDTPTLVGTAGSVLEGKSVIAISAGFDGSFALCSDGTLAAWNFGQVPDAVDTSALTTGERFVRISTTAETWSPFGLVATPPAPTVTTLTAALTLTEVTLHGTVSAKNNASTVSFEYGLTTAYGSSVVATPTPVTGSSTTPVSAELTGLIPGTTYHFRVKGVNAAGTSNGSDMTFTTMGQPEIAVVQSAVDISDGGSKAFGAIMVGSTMDLTFTIKNTGSASLTLNGTSKVIIGGIDAALFTIVAQPSSPVASAGQTTFTVRFTPTSAGAKTASLSIANDDSNENPFDIALTGSGVTILAASYTTGAEVPLMTNGFTATGNTVNFTLNHAPTTGTTLMVVNNTGLSFIQGTFSNLAQGQVVALTFNGATYHFMANYYGGTGNDLVLQWADTRLMAVLDNWGQMPRWVAEARELTGAVAGKTVIAAAPDDWDGGLVLCSDGTLAEFDSGPDLSKQGVLTGRRVIAIEGGAINTEGDELVLALCSDGKVAAWGTNEYGQLGNGSTTPSWSPVAVVTTTALAGKTVIAVAAGGGSQLGALLRRHGGGLGLERTRPVG